ncbi:MAG: shikimate kinase [Lachnospiraceae bacterium]|nr:shikimate kinase [Lachnospiraceae bacterium]
MDNITLIGMPGSGKSTVGVVLAKIMGYKFLDSDLLIQEREQRKLCDIIEEEGQEAFLKIEDEVNAGIEAKQTVIATGGSACYCESAMQHLREISTVVYIKLSFEEVEKRLGDLTKRGVVLKEGYTLKDLYEERCPLYEKYAHIIVDEGHLDLKGVVEKAKIAIENHKKL